LLSIDSITIECFPTGILYEELRVIAILFLLLDAITFPSNIIFILLIHDISDDFALRKAVSFSNIVIIEDLADIIGGELSSHIKLIILDHVVKVQPNSSVKLNAIFCFQI